MAAANDRCIGRYSSAVRQDWDSERTVSHSRLSHSLASPKQCPAKLLNWLNTYKLASCYNLPIRVWLKSANQTDQEPPDPSCPIARMFVRAGVQDQRPPDLAFGLFDRKFEELLIEIRDRLGAELAKDL